MSDEIDPKEATPVGDTGEVIEPETTPAASPTTMTEQGEAVEKKRPAWFWWAVAGGVIMAALLLVVLLVRPDTPVPQAVGLPQAQAEATITAAGLTVGKVSEVETLSAPPGTVVAQEPAAGETVAKNSDVDLSVAALPVVEVPDVVGKSASAAQEEIAVAGLQPATFGYEFSKSVAPGIVISQDPAAGSDTTVGSYVGAVVSKGEKQEQVPNVVGLSHGDAEDVLDADGFGTKTVKAESKTVPAGDVMAQSPVAGTNADTGSTVTITVSTGAPEAPTEPEPPTDGSVDETSPEAPQTPEQPPSSPGKPTNPIAPDQTTTVPNVVGMRVLEGIRALRGAQLKVDFAFGPSDDYVLKIASQDPGADSNVERGSVVTVTIGLPTFLFDPEFAPPKPTTLPADPSAAPPSGSEATQSVDPSETTAP